MPRRITPEAPADERTANEKKAAGVEKTDIRRVRRIKRKKQRKI